MTQPFTTALGELRVQRTLENDPAIPCLEVLRPDGRAMRARAVVLTDALDADAARAFEASAQAAAALDHPSLVVPRAWSSSPCYVAVDALDGLSLSELVPPGERASAELVVALGVDIAQALSVAHEASVLHGGVGPGAIVVVREGRAVLTDFAVAGLVTTLFNAHSHLLGSIASYLAPEQLESAPQTSATDVFALGSTLYRLLTGVFPFHATSPLGMTLKLSMGAFDPIESHAPEVPATVRELVHRMLAQAPADRPSAREVATELGYLAVDEDARRRTLAEALPPASPTSKPTSKPTRAPTTSGPAAAMPSAGGPDRPSLPTPPPLMSPIAASSPPAPAPYERASSPTPAYEPVAFPSPPAYEPAAIASSVPPPMPAPYPSPPTYAEPPSIDIPWASSAGFDDAPTEISPGLPELADEPLANTAVLRPAELATYTAPARASAPMPPPTADAPPPARAQGSVLMWVAIASIAFLTLIGTALAAIALAG